jgi:3-oxoacyl-[acyl-carrier-protein] synthase III
VAVLACLHIPLLQAIEEQANGPATESTPSGAEPDATANVDGGNSTKNTSDLATKAALEALKNANVKAEDIDLIILASTSHDLNNHHQLDLQSAARVIAMRQ